MGSFDSSLKWYTLVYLSYRLLLQFLVEVCQSWWSILYILIVDFNRNFYGRILTHLKTFMFEISFYNSLCWVLIWEFSEPKFFFIYLQQICYTFLINYNSFISWYSTFITTFHMHDHSSLERRGWFPFPVCSLSIWHRE